MGEKTVLLLEAARSDSPLFAEALRRKGFQVEVARSGEEMLQRLSQVQPRVAVINVPSLRSSGKRICRLLREQEARLPLVVILPAEQSVDGYLADVHLTLPLTARKLINRVKAFFDEGGEKILQRGPLRLNLETRQVHILGRSARLAPRLVRLLQVLMERAGHVVRREELFRAVWETSYVGDMRTLDVHIFWLRQAIEVDPRHPRFLKTVRGEGYRLDL
ncbi:MAG: response regulator transcription factor [Anaerolineales bacterium]